jgi:F-type H+-transporting ATPase subunit a
MASDHDSHGEEDHEEFKPGDMIMHHIGDAHDWHICDWDGHAVSVPLPIIIYHTEKGFDIFLSSKFDHGHATHNGYGLDHHGKIKVMDEHLMVDEESSAKLFDFSITKNVFALFVSAIIVLWLMFAVAKGYRRRDGKAPKGIQAVVEPIILFVRDDIAKASIGEKQHERFMPFLLTVFFFIWINNMLGLIPIPLLGGANVTGNIAVPLVLATFVFFITNFNGKKHYWRHTFAMPGIPIPVLIILTPIEIAQIFIRPLVLMIRLFANIMAGHIAMLVFFSLIFIFSNNGLSAVGGFGAAVPSIAFTVFLFFLELLVAAIQAYVFTLLTAIYFGMAVQEDHH